MVELMGQTDDVLKDLPIVAYRDEDIDAELLLAAADLGAVQKTPVHNQPLHQPPAMVWDELFYQAVKKGTFVILAGGHHQPREPPGRIQRFKCSGEKLICFELERFSVKIF